MELYLLAFFYFIISALMAAWAYGDAKDRGMDGDDSIAVFVAVLLLSVIGLVLYFKDRPKIEHNKKEHEVTKGEDPLKILKLRYAKGEITKKEFEEKKSDLA